MACVAVVVACVAVVVGRSEISLVASYVAPYTRMSSILKFIHLIY